MTSLMPDAKAKPRLPSRARHWRIEPSAAPSSSVSPLRGAEREGGARASTAVRRVARRLCARAGGWAAGRLKRRAPLRGVHARDVAARLRQGVQLGARGEVERAELARAAAHVVRRIEAHVQRALLREPARAGGGAASGRRSRVGWTG